MVAGISSNSYSEGEDK